MSAHTPGPWLVVPADRAEHPWIVGDAEGGSIASCEPPGPWMSTDEADANARMVAAAPDMLEALRELYSACQALAEGVGGRDEEDRAINRQMDAMKKAFVIIANAEGRK